MTEDAAAPAVGEEEASPTEEEEETPPPPTPTFLDMSDYQLKVDHFENIQCLPVEGSVPGAPNFRQVCGFPVYGMAQPTEEGLAKVMEKMSKGTPEKPIKTLWFNMRQEPVVYVNGVPMAPRAPGKPHENIDLNNSVAELDNLQVYFTKVVEDRLKKDPNSSLLIHKDSAYTENPMEREDVEETVKVEKLEGIDQLVARMVENGSNITMVHVPMVEERAPAEDTFDTLLDALKDEPASTQCLFSCQMGRGRTTMGLILCCLIKEIQISTELRKMSSLGLVPLNTVDDLIKQKFESPLPRTQDDDDPFIKGEFDVIKELLEKVADAVTGKAKVDRVIDICGPIPKGTGLQNLRECIIETKWKYDVAPEEKQVVWKQMILNFMERYFYLICFATYAISHGPTGFQKTFVSWMEEHSELRMMIEEGKDKLEWYRQVDPAKLNTLKDLINDPNYKENMATLIRTIYEFAFLTYSDLPRGPIKNNSMRKLAAKTLMEILPPDIASNVQKKLDEQNTSPDFVTLVGLVSYYGQDQPAQG